MTLYSIMLTVFAVLFWLFRVAVALTTTLKIDFFLTPLDVNTEIALAFVTLLCLIFVCRRNIIAATIYLISHLGYFGVFTYKVISNMFIDAITIKPEDYINLGFSIIGIVLPFLLFLDIGLSKRANKTTKRIQKTDWFYQNKQYDREYDERADRNQYKF